MELRLADQLEISLAGEMAGERDGRTICLG